MAKKISIVTGASSGLGRNIAMLLSEKGHVVYSVARRKEKLAELKKECSKYKGEIRVVAGDLTDKRFREMLISKVIKESKRIDYLINNAGYGKLTSLENTELKDIEGMFALNSVAGEHLAQLVLPLMKKKKEGRIINISSVVSFVPPAYFGVYNATKAAVHNFSKSLSYELQGTGVSVSVVFPARMNTGFWVVAFRCKGLIGDKQKVYANKWAKGVAGSLPVAKYVVGHLDSKRLILLPGFLPKIYYYIVKNIPFLGSFTMKHIIGPKTKKLLSGGKKQ